MAARNFVNENYSLARDVVRLYARGTGAATSALTSVKGLGVSAITRTGVGVFSLVLSDKYRGLLMFVGNVIDTGTVDDWEIIPTSDLTTGNTVAFQVFKGGAAADLPVTAKIMLEVVLSNSSQVPAGY